MPVHPVTDPLARVRTRLAARKSANLYRQPAARQVDDTVLDLAGNDYLGLGRDPRVVDAAKAAASRWGAGSTGSRLVTGTTQLHRDLEATLSTFLGATAALVFSSGYLANTGTLGALGGADVTVISDARNHASIVDGCRLSRSTVRVAPHLQPDAVRSALATRQTEHAVVVTDAVFSVDGALAPLPELHLAALEYGAFLLVDEAHSFGVLGPNGSGAVVGAGLSHHPNIVRTVTFSKALGSQGGAVVGDSDVIDLILNTARPIIFDTALAPAAVGASIRAIEIIRTEPDLPGRARRNAQLVRERFIARGFTASRPLGAVFSVAIGEPEVALALAANLLRNGVRVACFRPPTVPDGQSCLRLAARADLRPSDIDRLDAALQSVT